MDVVEHSLGLRRQDPAAGSAGVPVGAATPASSAAPAGPVPHRPAAPVPHRPARPSRGARARRALARWTQGWGTAAAVLVLATLVCGAIEPVFEPANLITVYLAGVVYVALRKGRGAAVLTVVCSTLLFDLLFVAPRGSLKPTDPQYFFSFAVMLAVGLIIGHLAANARQEAATQHARVRRTQALNRLALQLAQARSGPAVAAALESTIRQVLGLPAQLLVADDAGRLLPGAGPGEAEWPAADQALHVGRETGAGTPIEPQARRRYVPLRAGELPLGVLALGPATQAAEAPEDRALLEAIANQAAVALERAHFERRGARAAVEAERERLRSTLLAGISHDFRTPLTTIVGSATSLLEQREAIDEIRRDALLRSVLAEARRMHALTSDLLDLTRMEEGAVRPVPEWCPADELVDEARAALGARLEAHRLLVDIDADSVVWCDPRLLGQALVNLLDNAVRHTPAGATVRVGVQVSSGTWQLVVHDDGPGIPPGQEGEVFKKFHRGQQDPDTRGTGLGLAICAVVAELHGGRIAARNDGGARIEMTLPQPDDATLRLREAE